MSPRHNHARGAWRGIVVVGVAALVLGGCNSSVARTHVTGLPSIGISVPLHTVACTTTGSCLALGTTGADTAPSSVGEYRENNGQWSSLVVPSAPSSVITSASCWSTGCLIGGEQSSGSLLWGYNASSQSISSLHAPAGGLGIRALSCFGASTCAAVMTTGFNSTSEITFTNDGGATWSTPIAIAWSLGDTVSGLACTNPLNCMTSATTASSSLVVEVTHDGGNTWDQRITPSPWLSLSSITCAKLHCVGLAQTATSTSLVRTSTFGRLWRTVPLGVQANALACSTIAHCVIGGQQHTDSPWLATLDNFKVSVTVLKYVPSPVIDIACATKICAGIGVSTVLALRP
jgi:hypothetical protein